MTGAFQISDEELRRLMRAPEAHDFDRKRSLSDKDKICQAVCAFANDLIGSGRPGVLLVGVEDDGTFAGLPITEELVNEAAAIRSDGNILPMPVMDVTRRTLEGGEILLIVVHPSPAPPVRYRGRTWVRVGASRQVATREEEARLSERSRSRNLPFDTRPFSGATFDDLNADYIRSVYLPAAIGADVLAANNRTLAQQLSSIRFASPDGTPTAAGLLLAGVDALRFVPGAFVQFVRFEGSELTDPIVSQRSLRGHLGDIVQRAYDMVDANLSVALDVTSGPRETASADYPRAAIHQILANSLMHRDYELSNAPVRVNWFSDRIEIQNPGGPFGQVTRETFGNAGLTDYRNPTVAEGLKVLGYVQRFGIGIMTARNELRKNGNPELEYEVQPNFILARLRRRK